MTNRHGLLRAAKAPPPLNDRRLPLTLPLPDAGLAALPTQRCKGPLSSVGKIQVEFYFQKWRFQMKRSSSLLLLSVVLFSEFAFAGGPFCRARRSPPSTYYRPSVVVDYESPRRRIDYDSPRSTNDFGQYNGQIINDGSGPWKWDAAGQIWRGPVTETTYRSVNNGPWVPVDSRQYWRK